MAFIRDYQPQEYSVVFDVTDGDHVLKCAGAGEKITKNGLGMLEVYFKCDSSQGLYTERFVEGDFFNRNVTKLFDCLGVPRGDFDFNHWRGKEVVGHFEHEEQSYTDNQGNFRTVNKCVLKYLVLPVKNDNVPNNNTQPPISHTDNNMIF